MVSRFSGISFSGHLALGLSVVLAVACSGSSPDDAPPENVLHIGNGTEPETLDPHIMTGHPEFSIAWALFEGLAILDPATLEPIPGTAESWEISDDGLAYRFNLRGDAKWSNGEPVTAHDFVFGWRRILSPGLAGAYAEFLFCIENARAFNAGEMEDFGQVGVRAEDDRTLVVRLARPTPHFLFLQSLPPFFPVHEASLLIHGEIDARGTKWTRPGSLISNGPFLLLAWQPNRILSVGRSVNYWDASNVRLNRIDFHPIQSLQTEERAFRTGKLHLTNGLAPNKIAVYQTKNPELLHISPMYGSYFYRFNTTRPPLDDPRVRRALAMAIDRVDIVENVARGGQKPAYSLVPPGVGYASDAGIDFDAAAARALLAEAGFPNGDRFPALTLLYNTSEGHRAVAEAIQHMWKSSLGIDIELVNQDWKVYLNTVKDLDYDIARGSWIGDYIDPATFLELFVTESAHNRAGYSNADYDALIDQAVHTRDRDERFALLRRAEAILLNDAPIAPIYTYANIHLQAPELRGWEANLLDYPSYRQAWLEPTKASRD